MVLEKLDVVYSAFAPRLKVVASDLNLAWTPELLSTGVEIAADSFMTRLGSAILNLVVSGAELGVSLLPQIGDFDRKFLHQMAAHSGTRVLSLLATPDFGIALNEAKGLGAALKARDFGGAKDLLVRDNLSGIAAKFKREFGGLGKSLGDIGKSIVETVKGTAEAVEKEVMRDSTFTGDEAFPRGPTGLVSEPLPVIHERPKQVYASDSKVAFIAL